MRQRWSSGSDWRVRPFVDSTLTVPSSRRPSSSSQWWRATTALLCRLSPVLSLHTTAVTPSRAPLHFRLSHHLSPSCSLRPVSLHSFSSLEPLTFCARPHSPHSLLRSTTAPPPTTTARFIDIRFLFRPPSSSPSPCPALLNLAILPFNPSLPPPPPPPLLPLPRSSSGSITSSTAPTIGRRRSCWTLYTGSDRCWASAWA